MADAARWREPVVPAATLVDEGRRALRDVGWDGRTPLVVVHPGAGGVLKRWPAEGFAAVLERLRSERALVLAIHQGPADADAVAALRARLPGPAIGLDEPSLPRLAGLLGGATAYLGNDSGVSHLAAALGTPAVVLFVRDALAWQSWRSEEHTSELQSPCNLVCRLLLEKKKRERPSFALPHQISRAQSRS